MSFIIGLIVYTRHKIYMCLFKLFQKKNFYLSLCNRNSTIWLQNKFGVIVQIWNSFLVVKNPSIFYFRHVCVGQMIFSRNAPKLNKDPEIITVIKLARFDRWHRENSHLMNWLFLIQIFLYRVTRYKFIITIKSKIVISALSNFIILLTLITNSIL